MPFSLADSNRQPTAPSYEHFSKPNNKIKTSKEECQLQRLAQQRLSQRIKLKEWTSQTRWKIQKNLRLRWRWKISISQKWIEWDKHAERWWKYANSRRTNPKHTPTYTWRVRLSIVKMNELQQTRQWRTAAPSWTGTKERFWTWLYYMKTVCAEHGQTAWSQININDSAVHSLAVASTGCRCWPYCLRIYLSGFHMFGKKWICVLGTFHSQSPNALLSALAFYHTRLIFILDAAHTHVADILTSKSYFLAARQSVINIRSH